MQITVRTRFDTLVAEMQKPAFERGVDALFNSSPEELGQTAVQALEVDRASSE